MKPLTLAILAVLSAGAQATERVAAPAQAQAQPATDAAPAPRPDYLKPTDLDTLKVIGQRLFPYQEGMVLNERYIEDQVKGNGDIGTLLRINPSVQFDDSKFSSSRMMGEIRPSEISINGGLYYQNLFQLDGASFNNDLDPGSSYNPHIIADVPTTSQGIALDTDLIGRLTVYDSNVPAAFGSFNGGVIDAESRRAQQDFSGKVHFRMSRSAWNEQTINEADREDFELSSDYNNQPIYDKYKLGATLEGRLANGLGLIGTFSRTRSDIPLRGYSAGNVSTNDELIKDQRRENTSVALRADWDNGRGLELSASVAYAPTDERYFTQNAKNAYFDLEQGGPVASFRANLQKGKWTFSNTLSYSNLDSSRSVEPGVDYWKAWARSPAYDWGVNNSSFEGNWGNVDQTSRNLGYKLVAEREPIRWGDTQHHFQFGMEYRDREASYERLNDHYSYLSPGATTTCNDANGLLDEIACSLSPVYTSLSTPGSVIAGRGQYFRTMNIYSAGYFQANAKEWAVFFQDDIRLGSWSIRPGIRVDGDDLMREKTVAPRLALSWDVFGDQNTLLTAGANRYYGRNFFGFLLREGRDNLQTTYARTATTLLWNINRRYTANNRFQDLDIPYSDELSIGANQRWAGLDFNFKYVQREGRDEILRQRVPSGDGSGYYSSNVYEYVNKGRSSTDTYTLSIGTQRPLRWRASTTTVQLAMDQTTVKRNYSDYDSAFTDVSYNRWVRYNGELMRANELPQGSYNRPWTARLATQTRLDAWGLSWSNFFRYRAGYRSVRHRGLEEYQGESIDTYSDFDYAATWTWDSSVEYSRDLPHGQQAYARIEAQNLTNRRNGYASSTGTLYFEPGRSYWLEVGYRF